MWMRVRAGKTDSNRTTALPASARCSVRAARKMVSPSGMATAAPCQQSTTHSQLHKAITSAFGNGILVRRIPLLLFRLFFLGVGSRELGVDRRSTPHHETHRRRREARG